MTDVEHFGASGYGPDSSLTAFFAFSGPAAAGDWIVLVAVGGADGGGLDLPTVETDLAGALSLYADETVGTDTEEIRATWWARRCVGGEQTVTVEWGSGSNKVVSGMLVHNLTQPGLYLMDVGALTWDGSARVFASANPPASEHESYFALSATGRTAYSTDSIDNPPGENSASGTTLSGAVAGTTSASTNESAHHTSDVLSFSATPDLDGLVAFFATSTTPDSMTGTLPVALAGTGTLEVDTLPTEEIGGVGRFVGGRGRLAIGDGPPTPVVPPQNVLGCGVYEVLAFTRGLGFIVGNLEFDEVEWGRQLDATSQATLTIDGVSNLGALERCCQVLGELEPFEHELAIYRAIPGTGIKRRVWSGPITRMRFPSEQAIIEAFDLSGWLSIRTLHQNHNFVQVDLIEMWVQWVQDAMAVENSAGVYPVVVALSGILGDRLTTIVEHDYAADAIAEIATTGIDWTTVDRVMRAGPVLPQPAFNALDSLPLLIDESFRVAPEIIIDGLGGANTWFVQGGSNGPAGSVIFGEYGPAFDATDDHVAQPAAPDFAAIEAQYGRIERVASESRILDQPSIDKNAQTRYALGKRLLPFITGGGLLPTAPLPIEEIIPGALVRVNLARACKPVDATMRIQSLAVTASNDGSETVDLGLEPIGTVSNDG